MKHQKIIVTGEVQRVGYRDRVTKIARSCNITGIIRNCPGYDVEIIAEGTEEDLKKFTSGIRIHDDPIHVESITITPGTYEGKWAYFEIQRGNPDEELGERLDAALAYLARSDKNTTRSVEIGELMLDKQDQMLGKQDETVGEIRSLRTDLNRSLDDRFSRVENELKVIKDALERAGILA
ncbi:MAG: acylphosphatase [Methanospirillaceae archaeon]|nr:acylphosphatase [Methanospirillaceae archaeon]